MILCFASACGKDNASGSNAWSCDVTLTLMPSTLGNVSSPSGSGSGSGTGATQEEALRAALKTKSRVLNLISIATRGADVRVGRILGGSIS